MKKTLFAWFVGVVALSGCSDRVTETVTYMVNEPVFMSAKEFRSSVKVSARPQTITNCGKICFYNGFLYISETEKGIHIIDNRRPAAPTIAGFVELQGNADLAIRNGKLYADSYIDLVWFNIDNPALPKPEGRLENAFPAAVPSPDNGYGMNPEYCYGNYDGSKGVIVGWKPAPKSVRVDYNRWQYYSMDQVSSGGAESLNGSSGMSSGVNGSMSRFVLYKDYLYTVINDYMSIFDLSGAQPKKAAENIPVGGNVETIFSYKDNMFMGTPTGMLIYSVADPLKPEYVRAVWHVYGCDPVVVENDMAYVTVHSGNACGQNNNDLIVYDVSDVKDPKHIVSYAMTKPKGLGIDNGTLFVCDDGLKVFDAKDPQTIMANRLAHYSGMEGFDVIPYNKVLMMIAEDGLYQYDYTDVKGISKLSKLPIVKK